MTSRRGPREVRSGRRILQFDAVVLGSATSKRDGVPRWSELVVYGMDGGTYLISKIGHSLVAHTPDCERVTGRMPTWLEAAAWEDSDGEHRVHRVPCLQCQPTVGDAMDPQTRLEPSRYTVMQANTPQELAALLLEDRPLSSVPPLVREILRQVESNAPGTFPGAT